MFDLRSAAATVRRLAQEGAAVLVTDVLDEEGNALADEIRRAEGRALYEHLDVSSESEWKRAVDRAVTLGRVAVLINNARIVRLEGFEEETKEGYDHLISINQTGTWLGMKAVAAEMRKHGSGSIVNVSSIYGAGGGSGGSIACHASKGAVRIMTKNAAIALAKEHIRVNSVHPGFVDTPMIAPFIHGDTPPAEAMRDYIHTTTPMGRLGKPEEIAAAIAFLASEDASYVTGSELFVDGGFTAW